VAADTLELSRAPLTAAAATAALLVCSSLAGATVPGGDGLIAYTSNTAGNTDIWAVGPCDSGAQPLVTGSNGDGDFQIYAMRKDGGPVTRITTGGASDTVPDWQRFAGGGQTPPDCRQPAPPTRGRH